MKKLLLLACLLLAFTFTLHAQNGSSEGGAGVCAVNGDPDDNADFDTNDERYNCQLQFDRRTQTLYAHNPGGPAGDKYTAYDLTQVVNTDTRLSNPRVTGDLLTFDVIDVANGNAVISTVTVDVSDIAPVQDVVGAGDISVTSDANGTFTVTYNATVKGLAAGVGISVTDDGNGNFTVTNTAPNVDQAFGVSSIGGLARLLVANGGNVDFIGGNGITISVSGNDVTIDNDISTTVFAKNHAAAGTAGVAIGETFKASNDNTMGASPGTIIERRF